MPDQVPAVRLFGDLGAAGFKLSEAATVFGYSRRAIYRFLATNPSARSAYKAARENYTGPGGARAALRVALMEEDRDALIVAGVLRLGQRGDSQSGACLARLARRLALTGAPELRLDSFDAR